MHKPQFRVVHLPVLLSVAGTLIIMSVLWATHSSLGEWTWLLWPAAFATLSGTILPLIKPDWFDDQIAELRRQLGEQISAHQLAHVELESDRQTWLAEVEQQVREMEVRERQLASRLTTFHEWLEFPQPINVLGNSRALSDPTTEDAEETPVPESAAELARKDREMLELLRAESQRVFSEIRANKYVVDGRFQPLMLRDEAWQLAQRVAAIYRPESPQPLLETTPDQLFRAASRVCLQFLVALDELPLNVKEYNLSRLYTHVRQAVKAYDVYKSVEPYWGYVNSAFYLGRLALGANPLSLGAWWVVTTVGKKGAERLTESVVNRHAISLLHNLIRIVGFEVSAMYGGDFRHRDANWIYAVELVELVHRFPLTRESLNGALRELGALQLRSEYDRIFLYRCLAAHASAAPDQYRGSTFLTMEERRAIANRLENALTLFIRGKLKDRVAQWKDAVEQRLGVKLAGRSLTPSTPAAQLSNCVRSVAGYVTSVKELEIDDAISHLNNGKLLDGVPEDDRRRLVEQLRENPPYFFEYPDVEPQSPWVQPYLDDLIRAATAFGPYSASADDVVSDTATFLKQELKSVRRRMEDAYQAILTERWIDGSKARKLPVAAIRTVLELVGDRQSVRFAYDDVKIELNAAVESGTDSRKLWIVGIGDDIWGIDVTDDPHAFWKSNDSVSIQRRTGIVYHDCEILGGEWTTGQSYQDRRLRISVAKFKSFDAYFGPLLQHVNSRNNPLEKRHDHPS